MAGARVQCQTAAVPPHRDIAAFEDRAVRYEEGWRGRMHHDIADRTAVLAASMSPAPRRVPDIGCGTGRLLLVDLFSPWLIPTLVGSRRAKARTRGRAGQLLSTAGFTSITWHDLYAVIIKAVTATA